MFLLIIKSHSIQRGFPFGERKKSLERRSNELGGYINTGLPFFAENVLRFDIQQNTG